MVMLQLRIPDILMQQQQQQGTTTAEAPAGSGVDHPNGEQILDADGSMSMEQASNKHSHGCLLARFLHVLCQTSCKTILLVTCAMVTLSRVPGSKQALSSTHLVV